MMEISERQLQMISPDGFDKLFIQELQNFETQEQCYEYLEKEYCQAFGRRRYSNFDSFRISRYKRLRRKLANVNPATVKKAI